jgi:TP901 family phage tail tape measure protein
MAEEEVVIKLTGDDQASDDLKRVQRALRQAEEDTEDVGEAADDASGKTSKFQRALGGLRGAVKGGAMALGGLSVAAGGVATALGVKAVSAAGDFQQSLTASAAKVDGTRQTFKEFEQAAISAGLESAFSAQKAADGLGFLAQAGFKAEQATKALPGVLNLASAANMELAEASDIASNVLSGMGLEVEELGRVNDVLVKTANSANTNVSQMGQAMSMVAPVASSMGVELEQASAAIGILSNAGLQATKAGTGLRQVITKMAAPTTKLKKLQKDLGVQFRDSQGQLRDFNKILYELEEAGLSGERAMGAFGARAGTALAALMGEGANGVDNLRKSLENAGGTAESVKEQKLDTFNGAVQVLNGSFETLLITIGDAFLPILQDGAERLTSFTNDMREAATSGGDLEQMAANTAEGFAKFIRMTAPALDIVGAFVTVSGGAAKGLMDIADSASWAAAKLDELKAMMSGDAQAEVAASQRAAKINRRIQERNEQFNNMAKTLDGLKGKAMDVADGIDGMAGSAKTVAQQRDQLASVRQEIVNLQEKLQFGDYIKPVEEEMKARIDRLQTIRSELLDALGQEKQSLSESTGGGVPDAGGGGGGGNAPQTPGEDKREEPKPSGGKKEPIITKEEADEIVRAQKAMQKRNTIAKKKLAIMRAQDPIQKAQLRRELKEFKIARKELTPKERELQLAKARRKEEKAIAQHKKEQNRKARQAAEQQGQTVKGLRRAASVLEGSGADIAGNLAPVLDTFAGIKEGEKAASDAIGAMGKATKGFAEQLGASAEAQAGIMAVFELAMGFATMFTNPAESAGHFIAAANFGTVAATGAGGKKSGGQKGGAGGGKGSSVGQSGSMTDPKKAAKISGRTLAEQLGGELEDDGGGETHIYNMSGTFLEESPEVQRRLERARQQSQSRSVKRKAA